MDDSRPALVIGASGSVGGSIVRCLRARGPVIGTHLHTAAGPRDSRVLDATSAEAVATVLDQFRPRAVVIAAALADVDRCEKDPHASFAANVVLPATVAKHCAQRDIALVHLSTDYVFDGMAGPYGEDDPAAPINVYGSHKLEGELAVLTSGAIAAVLRTCVVYGGARPGAPEAIAAVLRDGRTLNLSAEHVNSPTHADDLAWAVDATLRRGATGLIHVAGPEPMSRLRFGRAVAEALGYDPERVQPLNDGTGELRAPRPKLCGLRINRAEALLDYRPRPVAEGLRAGVS